MRIPFLAPRSRAAAPPRPDAKASAAGPLIAFQSAGRPAWTPRDYAALAKEGYARNAIAYRCVRLIAEASPSVPWLLYDGAAEVDEHPLLSLLARPNRGQAGADFREALAGYLLTAGNAYVESVAVDGTVRELHTLRPDRMKVVPGSDGWPEAYEYTVSGRTARFPVRRTGPRRSSI
jgi:phage portal protein BeeE